MQFICDYCGKKFVRTPNQIKGKNKFCSRKCAVHYRRENGTLGKHDINDRSMQHKLHEYAQLYKEING